MDNFMDKLAQKFNAQEIIKANAQAEASEMQKLQEQVAAYESILQDMRKLNYKNSELTDKIYALVDESISKVQGIQPGEGGDSVEVAANISANLSDAIMIAVDEALSNLDSAFGTALNESVSGALLVPMDEMKQSSLEVSGSVAAVRQVVDEVKNSASEVYSSAADIRYSSDLIRTSADDVSASASDVRSSAEEVKVYAEEVRVSAEEVKESMESVKSTVRGVMLSTEDVKNSTEEIKTTTEDLKVSTEDLKTSVKTAVDNALLAIRRENREIADHLEYIRTAVDTSKQPSPEEELLKEEEEQKRIQEENAREEARTAKEEEARRHMEDLFKQSDDFVHKENVKVYRNVQAVVVDEFKSQTDGLTKHNRELYSQLKSTKTTVIIAIVLGAINIAISVLHVLNIL